MFSARKLLTIVLASIAAAGCAQRIEGSRTQRLSPAPIIQDEAMALRDWSVTPSYYANGSSVAYPTLYPYEPRTNVPEAETLLTAPALFVGQTLLLPITALTEPAWEQQVYRGVYTPPTYTAVPVVEPDAVGYTPITKWERLQPRPGREEDRPGARR